MYSLMKKRRSIRAFKSREVEEEKIDQIIQTVLLSPSSKNKNPWKFIVVNDQEMLFKLSDSKAQGSQFLAEAPLAIVVLADSGQSDVWIEDSSIATTVILLSAQSLGLGSCWIQLRERSRSDGQASEEFVADLLGVPDHFRILCMVAIGYPDEKKPEKQIEEKKMNDVFLNRFGDKLILKNQ